MAGGKQYLDALADDDEKKKEGKDTNKGHKFFKSDEYK